MSSVCSRLPSLWRTNLMCFIHQVMHGSREADVPVATPGWCRGVRVRGGGTGRRVAWHTIVVVPPRGWCTSAMWWWWSSMRWSSMRWSSVMWWSPVVWCSRCWVMLLWRRPVWRRSSLLSLLLLWGTLLLRIVRDIWVINRVSLYLRARLGCWLCRGRLRSFRKKYTTESTGHCTINVSKHGAQRLHVGRRTCDISHFNSFDTVHIFIIMRCGSSRPTGCK